MCGIAGYFSSNNFFNRADVQLMMDAIAHRGPDADGFFTEGPVALGHKRLSIIDLSANANQPMYSHNQRYVMVYNGEVYNYIEIAANEKSKHKFDLNTSSDSEIILETFALHGVEAVKQFNGMFAFAIYDKEEEALFIFRDTVGIKPLYYYWHDGNLAFASELKAIKSLKQIKFEINHEALYNYLHLGYIPAPQSCYQNIYKLEAGCWLKISKNGLEKNYFNNLTDAIEPATLNDEAIAKKKLDMLLNSSVKMQMRSDVPFGVFLSGGTDSSMVAAMAVKNSNQHINTFSIGFKEKTHNEAVHAAAIANHLKTNHHEFIVTYDDGLQLASDVMLNYDEPFADSSAIPTYLVSQLARKHVKVVLSGDGGDELFFGYGAHQWAERLNTPVFKFGRKPMQLAFSQMQSRYKRIAGLLNFDSSTYLASHIFSQEQYLFSANEISELLSHEFAKHFDQSFFKKFLSINQSQRKLTDAEQQALFDLKFYLPEDLLVKVDRASMKHSLEVRVPILDYRIVEFALNLNPQLKNKNGIAKYLLKLVLYDYIPRSLLNRPKQGFSIPLNNWLKNELHFLIENHLNKNTIIAAGILNYESVASLIARWKNGSDYLCNRIWQLIVLQQWWERISDN
ncbi:MAG: asparagine synthase (glutamine-hydrolyzing) [Bacteroidia bacterium]